MFSLTKQERLVLIFVAIASLMGLGLNFYKKSSAYFDLQKIIEEQKSLSAVNLNKASFQDLAKVSVLGSTLAEAIIEFRSRHGPFKSLEELKLIKGIDESKFNQIKKLLIIN